MAVLEQGVFWHRRSRSADAIGAQLAKLPHKINHLQSSRKTKWHWALSPAIEFFSRRDSMKVKLWPFEDSLPSLVQRPMRLDRCKSPETVDQLLRCTTQATEAARLADAERAAVGLDESTVGREFRQL